MILEIRRVLPGEARRLLRLLVLLLRLTGGLVSGVQETTATRESIMNS